ncbi:MAG: Spy/CpxP family protein refolding chaperone [Elusimicrobia bacterium]|nr:Spy/CpxP family protein refolding chaperone [Elusimicrobiota bacterium]
MRKRHGWAAALLGAAAIGMLAAGNCRAQAGGEAKLPFMLENRPLLGSLLRNLGKWAELRKELGLTQDQKQKIAEILKSRKPEIAQAVRKLRAERKKVLAAVRSDAPSEAAIRAAVANMTGPLADAAVLRSQIRREVTALLTPKQRGQVDKFLMDVQSSSDEAFAEFEGK